jgi:hypothetical protein
MNNKHLLLVYRDYVDKCITDSTNDNLVRPMSFDEWYVRIYEPESSLLEAEFDERHSMFPPKTACDLIEEQEQREELSAYESDEHRGIFYPYDYFG